MTKLPTIAVPAVIEKKDIAACAALYGKANSTEITLDGKKYKAKSVRYETFAGALDAKSKKYRGEHRFAVGDFSTEDSADLTKLPNTINGEPKNVLHAHS